MLLISFPSNFNLWKYEAAKGHHFFESLHQVQFAGRVNGASKRSRRPLHLKRGNSLFDTLRISSVQSSTVAAKSVCQRPSSAPLLVTSCPYVCQYGLAFFLELYSGFGARRAAAATSAWWRRTTERGKKLEWLSRNVSRESETEAERKCAHRTTGQRTAPQLQFFQLENRK